MSFDAAVIAMISLGMGFSLVIALMSLLHAMVSIKNSLEGIRNELQKFNKREEKKLQPKEPAEEKVNVKVAIHYVETDSGKFYRVWILSQGYSDRLHGPGMVSELTARRELERLVADGTVSASDAEKVEVSKVLAWLK